MSKKPAIPWGKYMWNLRLYNASSEDFDVFGPFSEPLSHMAHDSRDATILQPLV